MGRSDSATDNAPLDMYDTTIMLKPREKWRPGMTYEKLIAEMDAKLQFPGLTNTWTMPVRTGSTWNSPASRLRSAEDPRTGP